MDQDIMNLVNTNIQEDLRWLKLVSTSVILQGDL